jgi:hypothetical protein
MLHPAGTHRVEPGKLQLFVARGSRTVKTGLIRTTSFLALLFQLAWSTALPVLHAESEVLASQAAFERSHTADCPRLHDPAHSATCSAVAAPATRTIRYLLPPADLGLPVFGATANSGTDSNAFFTVYLPRSPPSTS